MKRFAIGLLALLTALPSVVVDAEQQLENKNVEVNGEEITEDTEIIEEESDNSLDEDDSSSRGSDVEVVMNSSSDEEGSASDVLDDNSDTNNDLDSQTGDSTNEENLDEVINSQFIEQKHEGISEELKESNIGILNTSNPILDGMLFRERDGSTYWTTSNLREWLNSQESNVTYTNQPPSSDKLGISAYDNEPGFLHGFTNEERNAIAVTQRRAFLIGADEPAKDGGNTNMPEQHVTSSFLDYYFNNLETVWKNYHYQIVNEKVFMLAPHELYTYVQKRAIPLKKGVTNHVKQRYNISSNTYSYYLNGAVSNGATGVERVYYIDENGKTGIVRSNIQYGVAPALHLKPDYVLKNNKKARDLAIGEIVTFGRYQGEEIKWIVVNKTNQGYPLLWSEKILTLKVYDTHGDKSYQYSNSINFQNHDVSIVNDLQVFAPNGETVAPVIKIVNLEDLNSRQNGSWVLKMQGTDSSGIKSIILPNGTVVNGDYAEYEVTENKIYEFIAIDNAGNEGHLSVPVGNINPPSSVIIHTSTDGWTNKDVTVDIFASNQINDYENNLLIAKGRDTYGTMYPNFTTYAGKRFKVSGSVELVDKKADTRNITVGVGFRYYYRYSVNNGYHYTYRWATPIRFRLSEIDGVKKNFEFIYTVSGDYFKDLIPFFQIDHPSYENGTYMVEWTDIKYELLDKDDFDIDKIILPDGTEISSNSYTDTLTEEGSYTYRVLDNRGMITEKTVEVKIDKDKPTLTITPDTTDISHDKVVLHVTANDSKSGVKRIQKPNGEWENKSTLEYNVFQNGTYTFTVEDNAGNQTTKTININNIDKTLSMDTPDIKPFEEVVLQEQTVTVATDIYPITVQDWRDNQNNFELRVSANQFKRVGSSDFLPKGTILIKPVLSISRKDGNGELPTKGFHSKQVLDEGEIILVGGNNSRGEYEIIFPDNGLEININPTTAKVGDYQTTLIWNLVQAP